ncbi:hypothetical protein FK535_09175 [Mycolicibacterium sp. 018/SC-01/001]|uniref:hypothetical protein n=1 Tax=Mycolicibacterium sp. 018/SC-01/001 TaxID=2592069 RepID=UPI00117E2E28|nr:hypothetical protein [Mycolicibacterium sp. 018/SC-01/001]TRW85557.1 hypothetical protein FK535_09175 [Mycolicibacterium sp. 018/SC-01/001]
MARIDGVYVGLGEGDSSDEIAKIKEHLKRKYTPARNALDDGPLFTPELTAEVKREQAVFIANGTLEGAKAIPGIINLAFKYACGYLKKEKLLPLYFSTEGHMSDPAIGPVAYVGDVLSAEGRALHIRTYYDRWALPFKNQTGVDTLANTIGKTEFWYDDGTGAKLIKFPPGTPWAKGAFSQGSMVWFDFYHQYLAPGKPLNWRLKDIRGAVVCGDPNREKGVCVPWIADPPAVDHQGIMDVRWENTPEWMIEVARRGDLYTDNESEGDAGLYKTAVAKIVTQNSWTGGPAGMLARVIDLLSPADDLIPLTMAIIKAIMFLGNMGPHGIYPMDNAVQFLRERLAT